MMHFSNIESIEGIDMHQSSILQGLDWLIIEWILVMQYLRKAFPTSPDCRRTPDNMRCTGEAIWNLVAAIKRPAI